MNEFKESESVTIIWKDSTPYSANNLVVVDGCLWIECDDDHYTKALTREESLRVLELLKSALEEETAS